MMLCSIATSCVNVHGDRMSSKFSLLYVLSEFHHQSHELINVKGVIGELGMMSAHGGVLTLHV